MKDKRPSGEIRHKELSFRIVGCAQRVHSALGPGFPEKIYQRALCCELMKTSIPFESQQPVEVYYDGNLCGEFQLDLLVDEKVIVELKSAEGLCDAHVAQAITYLKATGKDLAILINFGQPGLVFKRVVL